MEVSVPHVPKILVVDDEPRICDSLKIILGHGGYEILTSCSGKEALACMAQHHIDLVILDMVMPETDGWAVLDSMAGQEVHTKVIAMSGNASVESAVAVLKSGACDYLKKPFGHDELLGRVRSALSKDSEEKRKTISQHLERSERRYRFLVQASPDIIYTLDREGRFTFVNDAVHHLLGFTRQELIGSPYTTVIYEKDLNRANYLFNERRTGDRAAAGVELRLRIAQNDNGTEQHETSFLPIELKATGVYESLRPQGSQKRYLGTYGVARDTSNRKRAEEALQRSEERYRALFENSPIDTVIVDHEARVTDFNLAKRRSSDRLPKVGDVMYKDYAGKHGTGMLGKLRECMRTGLPEEFPEQRYGDRFLHIRMSPFSEGAIITSIDITAQKRIEAQFQQAQKIEAIGTLAGGIAHDFNNLLMAVLGNTSLILHDVGPDHPHYERLKNIEEHVRSGAALTRQLLGYARQRQYELQRIDLNALVKETAYAFGRTRKDTVLYQELAEGLYEIDGDKGQMEQVLLNLYVNAAEAMPGGGSLFLKTVNRSREEVRGKLHDPQPGNYVLLTVTDTGIGMDRETRERVFDPFFTTKELGRGTGLGLASAYSVVKSHGGHIEVASKKGKGTTFSIYLPATKKREETAIAASEQSAIKGRTILLVDDEKMILDIGGKVLNRSGYHVLKAAGGKEALQVYKRHKDKIDLVILDMRMPDMGGSEVYNQIKEIDPGVKVLLASGYSIDSQVRGLLDRGCNGFIEKPYRREELTETITEILDKP
ncbi:MAG: response regulator [Thermodesulfobacteriota bacterium]|nr:response regulator [Thermodesulfobacteriota bacterium]